MKLTRISARTALTRKEVVVILATLSLLALIGSAWVREYRRRSQSQRCILNLKTVSLSFKMFSGGCDDRFPALYAHPLINPQTGIDIAQNSLTAQPWMHFQVMSNELGSPKYLVCPADVTRVGNAAKDFGSSPSSLSGTSHRDNSVSYFLNLQADETKPLTLLVGDRNLAPAELALPYSSHATGAVYLTRTVQWSKVGAETLHEGFGHHSFSDGSVQIATAAVLHDRLSQSDHAYGTNSNHALFPQ